MDEVEGDLLNIKPPLAATSTQVIELPEPPKAVDVISYYN
jgi:hypothetical protein